MKILGLNSATKNLWVVYMTVNKAKYFVGAYRTEEKASAVAAKYNGKYFFKN